MSSKSRKGGSSSSSKKMKRVFTQEEKDLLNRFHDNFVTDEVSDGLCIDVKSREMPDDYDVSLNDLPNSIIDWRNFHADMIVLCAGKSATKPVVHESYEFAYKVFTGRVKHKVAETKIIKKPIIRFPRLQSTMKGLNKGDSESTNYDDNAMRLVVKVDGDSPECVAVAAKLKEAYYAKLAMLIFIKSDESDTFKDIIKRNEDYKTRCPVFKGMTKEGAVIESELIMLKLSKHSTKMDEFRGLDKKVIPYERLSEKSVIFSPYILLNRIYCGESNTSIQLHINSARFHGFGKERETAAQVDACVPECSQEEMDEYLASMEDCISSSSSSSSSSLKTSMRQPGSLSVPKLSAEDYLDGSDGEDGEDE
jgi:hypothetical protein